MKLSLARKPTPLEIFYLRGRKFYIKRDDLTDFVASGNKIRKLEYLLAEAVEMRVTHVITCGAVQSNHARATAYLSRRLGMKPVLFLKEWHPGKTGGNYMLDEVLGAEIVLISSEEYENVEDLMKEKKREIESSGGRAYIIPEGGSNRLGAKGYVDAVFEISRQIDLNEIDYIYVATSSAGTHAGLLAGLRILGFRTKVIGVKVNTKPTELIRDRIKGMVSKLGVDIDYGDIVILEGFVGPDYAVPSKEDIEIIFEAGKAGLILDPVYTAKAFRGMVETAGKKSSIFIHTGGTFGLLAQTSILEGKR